MITAASSISSRAGDMPLSFAAFMRQGSEKGIDRIMSFDNMGA